MKCKKNLGKKNNKIIAEKYNRIKLIQQERQKVNAQKIKLKEIGFKNVKGKGDVMMKQRIEELKEKEK